MRGLITLALAASVAFSQYGRGVILGTVSDSSGAVLPGVKVTARNTATNETREFTTDSQGNYQFTALIAGRYTVSASGSQFKTATVPDIELRVNSQVRADVVMQLGVVSETVSVQATTPQLQTNTAVMGTVIDTRTMIELPLNSRNFYDLAALTPGAVKVRGGSSVMDERSIEIGGVRNTSTNAMLDGVDFSIGNVNNPAIALSLDTIQEFKVQTNFMDASYGYGAAGIDMVSRRGANDFHGVVYDYVRNRAFQAGQFFRPLRGAPRFSYNQFGAAAGGKIRKDKTFYFGSWEARRRRTGNILQGFVPTPVMRQGDFNGSGKTVVDPFNRNAAGQAIPFPDNRIPQARFSRIARSLLEFFPDPNLTGRPGLNYISTPPDRERRDQVTGRVDHQVSSKGHLFGRYSFADNALVDAAYRVGKGVIRPDRSQNGALGYTHTFGANLIGETRLGFTKAYLARVSDGDRFSKNYAAELGLRNLAAIPGDYTEPNISLAEYNPGAGRASSGFAGYGLRIVQNNIYYRVAQTFTLIKDKHTMKFGADLNRLMIGYDQGSNQNGSFTFQANYSGDSFANYLLGIPQSVSGGVGGIVDQGLDFGGVAKYSIGSRYQYFFQDDIKLSSKLTLNIGVRYETFQQWRGRLANFDLGTNRQLLAGRTEYYEPGTGLVRGNSVLLPQRPVAPDKNNFLPRFGLAYRLDQKTVIRSGFGVFSLLNTGGASLVSMTSTLPFFVFANLVGNPTTPTIFMDNMFPTARESAGTVASNQDLRRRDGYMFSYNLNVQRQVTNNLLVELGYMGNTGHKQVGSVLVNQPRLPRDPNNPEPFTARQPFPRAQVGFSQTTNYQWSNYNAGFVRMEQRVTKGLSVTSAYTWAKTIDSGAAGQNMYDRRPERGLADNDIRHNFILGFVDDIPVGKGRAVNLSNRALDFLIGGWQWNGIINFRSGTYFSVATTGDLANVGSGSQRANATGTPARKLDPRTNNLAGLDRAAYSLPARGTFGTAARNVQPGYGINNWDISLAKNFPVGMLGEQGKLQLRFEWFNFFNHTQFNNPGATFNTPVFGLVTSAADPRIMQIAGRLQW
ncbi:MAG: TonB-dependent receptor [Acidobacteria bacterium]|nr:TonB-dependent receptor [Acidobacteriota bacterium]